MATRVQFRRGSAAQWTSTNPTLAAGEPGTETGAGGKTKVGDGVTPWNSLPYLAGSTGASTVVTDNGDGTASISGPGVSDNGDGTFTIAN